jgi:hypothetical protein
MREALARAWTDVRAVTEALRREHPSRAGDCRLAVREVTAGLLVIDRVVAALDER